MTLLKIFFYQSQYLLFQLYIKVIRVIIGIYDISKAKLFPKIKLTIQDNIKSAINLVCKNVSKSYKKIE